MPYLIRKKRFAECMLLGWQSVEDCIDQMTIQEFEMILYPRKTDPRVDMLRDNVGFRVKLRFLEKMSRISKADKNTILDFEKERNALFHGDIFSSLHPIALPDTRKTELMELAGRASQIASNRMIGVWTDEGTGDVGNKNVHQPDKPESVKWAKELKRRYFERVQNG